MEILKDGVKSARAGRPKMLGVWTWYEEVMGL